MKVLFAVNNEEISESIVKKYQKKYKEIISYKNVYYFNAILKEIQKDKTYDRIIVSEDLEQFTNTSYEQMDKFIFEKLDSISDEASNSNGRDIPIILICTERRSKSEEILVKLFGIGIYNAIIGKDRSIDEVCRLIYKPRLKKDAKTYYQIDSDNVSYKAENENDVSEVELQNVLAYFKKLGNNEAAYIESYDRIAAQYNDTQLKIISRGLPLGVRAVLEEKSPKYQQVMAFNKAVSENLRKKKGKQEDGLSQTLLTNPKRAKVLDKPIIVPTSMRASEDVKKLTRKPSPRQPIEEIEEVEQQIPQARIPRTNEVENNRIEENIQIEPLDKETIEPEKPKRGRGRPRKNPLPVEEEVTKPKRGRGRPKKNPTPVEIPQEPEIEEPFVLPQPEEIEEPEEFTTVENNTILPGMEDMIDDEVEEYNPIAQNENIMSKPQPIRPIVQRQSEPIRPIVEQPITQPETSYGYSENSYVDLSNVLQGNKRIVAFVGTTKNGTSFIVNNLAEMLSSTGINVAILDTTKNRNSFYIYTKNEENLRRTAMSSITNLSNGIANGIKVNSNLAVYTSLPNENEGIGNVQSVLETLAKSHTIVLIDCDFYTPRGYFSAAQELYLVQTMDVLTIQPLTAFLKDLVAQNIIEEQKIRVIINKYVKIRGITEREIIGGMAYYNDPAMTYQTGLFDKALVKYITIPFEEEIYTKYLQGLINCEISLKGYSKTFIQNLKQLSEMIYPMATGKGNYRPPALGNNGNGAFSSNMNNTLEQMKRNY
ncbi:MAG: hypothetical protein IKF83_04620 [Clostridia bacterium]|nr:hypothetical protein [Clostridia bacterium]